MKFNYLKIRNLYFKFNKDRDNYFFKGITQKFKAGRINFISGENGSGKSTLFRILEGKIDHNEYIEGEVLFDNKRFKQKNRIKLVPQKYDNMLAYNLSFIQNLKLARMSNYPKLKGLGNDLKYYKFIKEFQIDISKPINYLSGGQRQILSILMALQKSVEVLLLDEPTAALDQQNSNIIIKFLQKLVRESNLTVFIICHDRELMKRFSRIGYGHYEIICDRASSIRMIRENHITAI